MPKRVWSFLSLFTLMVALLAACGDTTTPTTSAGATTTNASANTTSVAAGATTVAATTGAATTSTGTTTAATGNTSDKLVAVTGAGNRNAVRNFNPFAQNAMFCTNNCAFEPLIIVNSVTGEIVPWLATAYKYSDDAKTLTFTLRDGVKWSDGQPFSATDVAFTFNLMRNKAGLQGPAAVAMAAKGGYVDTVTAPDAKTVVFTFKQPFSPAIYDLAGQNIVPEHIWKSIEDPSKATNETPVGTGPFTEVTNFTPQQYEVRRNPNYWQPEKIAFGGFKVVQGLSTDAQNLAIVNGEFDWTGTSLPNLDQVYVAKDPQNRGYWNATVGTTVALELVTTKKPFDDVNVRKAISMAINRKQIATVALGNSTHPGDVTGLSDGYAAWKVADPVKLGNWTDYNVAQANQLLDAAGLKKGSDGIRVLPDGTPMKYEINIIQAFAAWTAAGDVIVQNLKAVGIAVSLKPLDFGQFFDILMKGNYSMSFGYIGGTTPYQVYNATMSSTTNVPIGEPSQGNYSRFASAKADELLKQWASAADPAKQKDIAAQLQQEFAANVPAIPLYPQPYWMVYKTNNFTGFPTKDNQYAVGNPDSGNTNILLVFTRLKPR